MALIVLDIGHFKRVNDDFGHPAGDAVIQAVVRCLEQLLGQGVAIGRVGGEEFSVVLPRCRAGASFETSYGQADEALYAAKRAGRNCVRLYAPDITP
jgi:diguanylate cyclase (GGDEF)-like protein